MRKLLSILLLLVASMSLFGQQGRVTGVVRDAETGASVWVDTSSKAMRRAYEKRARTFEDESRELLNRYRIDNVSIATDQDYVQPLAGFFKNRGLK